MVTKTVSGHSMTFKICINCSVLRKKLKIWIKKLINNYLNLINNLLIIIKIIISTFFNRKKLPINLHQEESMQYQKLHFLWNILTHDLIGSLFIWSAFKVVAIHFCESQFAALLLWGSKLASHYVPLLLCLSMWASLLIFYISVFSNASLL